MAGTNTNSPTPPVAPAESDLWFNTTNGREYVWYISPGTGLGSWVQTQPTSEAAVPSNTPPTPPVTPPSVGPHDVTRVPTITVSQVPPLVPPPISGDQWWNTINGQLFVFYDDGTTTQWVLANRGTGEPGPPGPPGPLSQIAEGAGIILTPNPIVNTGVVAVDFTVVPHISDLGNYLPLAGGTLAHNGGVSLSFNVPDNALNAKLWRILEGNDGVLYIDALNDDLTRIVNSRVVLHRDGSLNLSGQVYVSAPGNTAFYIANANDATSGRPGVILQKQGVNVFSLSSDGISLGAVYYEAFGAGALHDFFVAGNLIFTIVPGGVQSNGALFATGSLVVGGNTAGIQHQLKMTSDGTIAFYNDGTAGEIVVDAFQTSVPTTKYTLNFNKYGGSSKFSGMVTLAAAFTVASLPAGPVGSYARVTDGTAALAWGAIVTGGGSTPYLVWHNGTNWTVVGK